MPDSISVVKCNICNELLQSDHIKDHIKSSKHNEKKRELLLYLEKIRLEKSSGQSVISKWREGIEHMQNNARILSQMWMFVFTSISDAEMLSVFFICFIMKNCLRCSQNESVSNLFLLKSVLS
jgi:hypothetical protein